MNSEFQKIARRDKKAFISDQCKEIEENNRMGKTRDLFMKIRDTKGTFHAKMGSIKDRNGMDLTPNLRHCQARSKNKGLSKYQRKARWLWISPSPLETGRQEAGSQSWKEANSAPERHPLPSCKQAPSR